MNCMVGGGKGVSQGRARRRASGALVGVCLEGVWTNFAASFGFSDVVSKSASAPSRCFVTVAT